MVNFSIEIASLCWFLRGDVEAKFLEEKPKRLWKEIRGQRNQLLQESDWTQFPDSPLSNEQKTVWNVYRQQLRDIPQDFKNPGKVEWPEKPK